MTEEDANSAEPPDIRSWLTAYIAVRRGEYEEQYSRAASEEQAALYTALDALENRAAELVTTGVLPVDLGEALSSFMPGDTIESKVKELLTYAIVHHRLEFDVAEDVCERLKDVDKRVQVVSILNIFLLLGYKPSETALKYFKRATTLFLAGYDTETIVMCGAVLEAALRTRFPDEMLRQAGMKPAFRKANDYSVNQRLKYEEEKPVLTAEQRKSVADLVNWRNDAVHVQPDVGPKPLDAVVALTIVLPILLP